MKTAKLLREERATKLQEANSIVATAEKEQRDLTQEEAQNFDQLNEEIENLDAQIERQEKIEARKAEEAGKQARKAPKGEISELRKFNISSFLSQAMNGNLEGFNREMHQEAEKEYREFGGDIKGFAIPSKLVRAFEKRDVTSTAEGDAFIFNQEMPFIEPLRNRLTLVSLGANFMGGITGRPTFPRGTSNDIASYNTENGSADEISPTTDQVQLTPKRLTAFVDLSKQTIQEASYDVQAWIWNHLMNASAQGWEQAAISGGGANQPEGILATSGIGSVAMGAAGGPITYDAVVELESAVAAANGDTGRLAYLTNSKVRGALKTTSKDSGSGQFIWNNMDRETPVNGYACGVSNLVPDDLNKGASVGVCSAMIFGDFSSLILGQWGGLDIMLNPYTKAKTGQVEVILNTYNDVLVQRAAKFAAITDITTS